MKKIFSFIAIIIICLCSTLLHVTAQQINTQALQLVDKTVVDNIELESGYVYAGFDANENYLVWLELYTQTIHVYDVKKKRIQKIVLNKGRGPHEAQRIISLGIVDSTLFISDYYNQKLIRVNINGTYSRDIILAKHAKAYRIATYGPSIYILNILNKVATIIKFDPDKSKNFQELSVNKSITNDFVTNYQAEGEISVADNRLVHITKYYPRLYVYDLKKRSFFKKITFDESEVEEGYKRPHSSGGSVILPPAKVDILNEDIALIPGLKDNILLLSKGKSSSREYGLDKLWVYDFANEKFIKAHDLGFNAKEITANDTWLFAYSEEENAIYRYKIVKPLTHE